MGVSIRVGLGRGRKRNLPLPRVVSLWFFLFGQAKRKNIRPSPAFAGRIRKRRSYRAGARKGEAKRRAPLRHDLKGEAKRKAPLSPLRGTSPQRGKQGPTRASAPTSGTLSLLISTFKRFTNRKCGVRLWQRSCHEHVIRNEKDFLEICGCIQGNPAKWAEDRYFVG